VKEEVLVKTKTFALRYSGKKKRGAL